MGSYDCILIHYAAEITLKGRNRPFFEKKLVKNIHQALRTEIIDEVQMERGRVVLHLNTKSNLTQINSKLAKVFGISWYAPAYTTSPDLDELRREVFKRVQSFLKKNVSIKVVVKRSNKRFPLTSPQLGALIGAQLVEKYGVKVSMKNPEIQIFIEVADNQIFIFFDKIRGLGGLPIDVTGRVLCLLSGGIDSAVAAWLVMKRGCAVDFLHFHPFRENEMAINSKITDLIKILTQYSFQANVHIVPAAFFQLATLQTIPPKYELILFRRFMLRVAERIAVQEGLQAIVTGDSLGQVASQTLENLDAQKSSVSFSILRPLLTYDKEEIIALAKEIGTYQISIRSYKDCCSLIASNPVTKANIEKVENLEKELDLERLTDDSLNMGEIITLPE
ncbi:MAG: tRNA uracil 4-sulfurtransferase ThiI [Candidatus Heimdallarchaeota archaeon]